MTGPHTGAPVELEPDMTQALADLAELKELSLRFGYDLFGALASLAESNAPFILGEIDDGATARAGHAVARFKLAERLDGALMALRTRNGNAHVGHEEISNEMIAAGLGAYEAWIESNPHLQEEERAVSTYLKQDLISRVLRACSRVNNFARS